MSKNVNIQKKNNARQSDGSIVMPKIACHYVSLPKVFLRKVDDPRFILSLNNKDKKIVKAVFSRISGKSDLKKVSPNSKTIPSKKTITKTQTKTTKKAISTILESTKKRSSRANKKVLLKSKITKPVTSKQWISKKSVKTGRSNIKNKVLKNSTETKRKSKTAVKTKSPTVQKKVLTSTVKSKSAVIKKPVQYINSDTMSDDDIMEELMNFDSDSSIEYSSDDDDIIQCDSEIIQSFNNERNMSNHPIKKQILSKNVIKLSTKGEKVPGTIIKGGIVKKNFIPMQSKTIMKKIQSSPSVNLTASSNKTNNPKLVSTTQLINKKQPTPLASVSKSSTLKPQQKALMMVQSVEAINSKSKKMESTAQINQQVGAKQTATVTPLSKAKKSFTSGNVKINPNKSTKEIQESDDSEPVNLLSQLVGVPISASKLEVVLSPQGASTPANNKISEQSKTQYVNPTKHNDNSNINKTDLLKILEDENETDSPNEIEEQTAKSNLTNNQNNGNGLTSKAVNQDHEMEIDESNVEEKRQRTIYDLMAEINLIYPSWNLHIMPDTNSFCIAQVSRGRIGIPILKKCIELDESYNAKVYVHQYHCKRFDGQYDSEESIIALIHEINALRA